MTERSVEHATFVVERSYGAPPERTFAAWADPVAKAHWFGGADGEFRLDFRVGGREFNRGSEPSGKGIYTEEAVYREIAEPERIVYTYDMFLDDTLISVSLATVEFLPSGEGGTRLVYTEQAALLDGHETPASREGGMGGLLDALGEYLEGD
jgi:uncharacterized protein YndB with AHSA1/START domain